MPIPVPAPLITPDPYTAVSRRPTLEVGTLLCVASLTAVAIAVAVTLL